MAIRIEKGLPGVSWEANDADGAAGNTDEDVQVLEEDPQQPEQDARNGVRRLGCAVAALNGAGAAGWSRGGSRSSASGDGDGSSGKGQSGQELELHAEGEEDETVRAVCL